MPIGTVYQAYKVHFLVFDIVCGIKVSYIHSINATVINQVVSLCKCG